MPMPPYVTPDTLAALTAAWLERIRHCNRHRMRLNAAAAALPTVGRLVEGFRRAGRPVIFTRHVHHPDGLDIGLRGWWWKGRCLEGNPESEIHPDLAPGAGEKVVLKHRYSAFYNTVLETVLRCLKVEDLVVSGIMTNMCFESTTPMSPAFHE